MNDDWDWIEDMASLAYAVLLIICACAMFAGLYWMVVA